VKSGSNAKNDRINPPGPAAEHLDVGAATGPRPGDQVRNSVPVHVGRRHLDAAGEGRGVREERPEPAGDRVPGLPVEHLDPLAARPEGRNYVGKSVPCEVGGRHPDPAGEGRVGHRPLERQVAGHRVERPHHRRRPHPGARINHGRRERPAVRDEPILQRLQPEPAAGPGAQSGQPVAEEVESVEK
jgi:hypothetical protein